jgi:hypothetical protein
LIVSSQVQRRRNTGLETSLVGRSVGVELGLNDIQQVTSAIDPVEVATAERNRICLYTIVLVLFAFVR